MKVRYAVVSGFLGRVADRFTQYQPHRTLAERFELASQIEGLDGFELVYPSDFEDLEGVRSLLHTYGFGVPAVNLNVKRDPKWRYGSFTAKDPAIRADAVCDMKAAMDLAAELGADKVTCCPLIDGHDYVFQVDYGQAWRWFVQGIREAARHRSDIRISMEYKMSEPRVRTILPNVGRALYLCDQVGLPNVGVTLDVGHAIQAGEDPAESLVLLQEGGIPVYTHTNDNPGDWDWDMLPGSVHLWQWLELFLLPAGDELPGLDGHRHHAQANGARGHLRGSHQDTRRAGGVGGADGSGAGGAAEGPGQSGGEPRLCDGVGAMSPSCGWAGQHRFAHPTDARRG